MALIINPRYEEQYRIEGPSFCNATIPDEEVYLDPSQKILDMFAE